MYSKPHVGGIDLNRALNDLVQAGLRDPNILLKYSQNPPPEFGANGKMLVSLAANAVARDKQAAKTMQPTPTKTVAEQVTNKLAAATQPGIAGLTTQAAPTQAGINTPAAEPTSQSMDSGVASLPVDEGMYDEQNYAGGGIVSFVKGGPSTDPYDYSNYRMDVPEIPTADDLYMQTGELKSKFVDPNYYADTEKTLKADTLADIADVKRMGQSDILFKLAEGFGTTPGGLLRGAVAAGTKAGPAVAEMNKNLLGAKRLEREAMNKLKQSKYAESVGDYKTASELRNLAEHYRFEANKTNATLGSKLAAERAKALKSAGLDEKKLRVQVEKVATERMKAQYPAGAFETLMRDRPDVYSAELNRYRREAEGYILNNLSAQNLPADYMDKLQANKTLAGKPGAKANKATATTRPDNINKILNKYPATGSRSTNTQEELDTNWDSAGTGLEDDE